MPSRSDDNDIHCTCKYLFALNTLMSGTRRALNDLLAKSKVPRGRLSKLLFFNALLHLETCIVWRKKGAKSKRENTKWRNLIRELLEHITHSENSWMTAAMWVMRVRTPTSSLQPSKRKERKNVEKQLSWVSAEHKSSLKVKFENETCYDLFRVINNNLEDLVHLKEKKKSKCVLFF